MTITIGIVIVIILIILIIIIIIIIVVVVVIIIMILALANKHSAAAATLLFLVFGKTLLLPPTVKTDSPRIRKYSSTLDSTSKAPTRNLCSKPPLPEQKHCPNVTPLAREGGCLIQQSQCNCLLAPTRRIHLCFRERTEQWNNCLQGARGNILRSDFVDPDTFGAAEAGTAATREALDADGGQKAAGMAHASFLTSWATGASCYSFLLPRSFYPKSCRRKCSLQGTNASS